MAEPEYGTSSGASTGQYPGAQPQYAVAASIGAYFGALGALYKKIEEVIEKYVQDAIMYGEVGNMDNGLVYSPSEDYKDQSSKVKSAGESIDSKVGSSSGSSYSGLENIAGSGGTTPYVPASYSSEK